MNQEECLFCKFALHKLETSIVYEDDDFIAFNDINPQAKLHILVIPKDHINSVAALPENEEIMIGRLIFAAKKIAEQNGLAKSGYRLVFNSGRDAGQAVDHIHLHLLGGCKLGPIAGCK